MLRHGTRAIVVKFRPRRLGRPVAWIVAYAALLLAAAWAQASPAPLQIEDQLQPLDAKHARNEAEKDRVHALALYATGRTLEQREQYGEALRMFERACRYDSAATPATDAVVLLAMHLKQFAVAARYLDRGIDVEEVGPPNLRRLAVYLTDNGDFVRAAAIYEKILAARGSDREDMASVLLHMELGRLDHLTAKYSQAADQFARVVDALEHPDRVPLDDEIKKALLGEPELTYQLFGEAFLFSGRLKEAGAAFEKSNALAPNVAVRDYNRARVEARSDQPGPALASLEACFAKRLSTEGLGPYELLAEVLKKLGKEKELLPRLEKIYAADPQNVPLGYYLAERYVEAKQFDKAEPIYAAVMKKGPTTNGYRALCEIYRKLKKPDALLDLLGNAFEKAGSLDVFGTEVKTLESDGELLTSLLEAGRRRLKPASATGVSPVPGQSTGKMPVAPDKLDANARIALALVAASQKKHDAAREFFEAAIAAQPKRSGEVLLTWGIGLLMDERATEAAKIFQRGIDAKALPENNPAFQFYLSGALAMSDRTDEALAAARKAAGMKKDSARFASRIPWILYHAKRNDEAIRAYEELVARFDGEPSVETRETLREVRLALSNLCVTAKRLPEAEEWLEQVLDEYPDDVSADNDLGYLWTDEGKHLDRSLRMIRRAVDAEPDNLAYRDSLGWAYFRLGRFAEAVVELEKAAKDKQPDATVLDHLGEAYRKAGQIDRARDAWRRSAEAFRKDKDEEKAKEVEQKTK
jgi:tetratricopeptide (TPR) repeat protein